MPEPEPAPVAIDESASTVTPLRLVLTVVVVLVLVAVGRFAVRLDDMVGLVLAAATLAALLAPVRARLRRHVGGAWSIVLTAIGAVVAAGFTIYVVLLDLSRQTESLSEAITERLEEVSASSFLGRTVRALDLGDAVTRWLDRIPSAMVIGADGGIEIGQQLVDLVMVVILAAFMLAAAPGVLDWLAARWPREHRQQLREFVAGLDRRGAGYVRRSALLATGTAAVVAGVAMVGGAPAPLVLGCWAGAWCVVPAVGAVVGVAPAVAMAFLNCSSGAVVAAVAAVTAAAVAVPLRRRFVDTPTLPLGVGPHVVAVAVGVAMGGLAGSAVALMIVAVVGAALRHPLTVPVPRWHAPDGTVLAVGRLRIPTGWRGVLTLVAATVVGAILWTMLGRLGPAVVWVLVGLFVAVALSRPVGWVQRRAHLSRPAAAAVVLLVAAAVIGAVGATGLADGAEATVRITEELPEVVEGFERTPLVGGWLRDREASVWVADRMTDLPSQLASGDRGESWLPMLGDRLADLFWTVVVAIGLLLDGPRLLDIVRRRVPAPQRRQFARLVHVTGAALGGYAAGAAFVAGINGTVVFLIAVALGVGLAPLLAVWAFVWNFVPQIGGFMGGLPLLLFALVAGPARALLAGLLFVTYQFVENHLIQPTVIGNAIDLPAWATLLAALAGGAAGGVVGAVVLTPLVGVIKTVVVELRRADFPGATVSVPSPAPPPEGRGATAAPVIP